MASDSDPAARFFFRSRAHVVRRPWWDSSAPDRVDDLADGGIRGPARPGRGRRAQARHKQAGFPGRPPVSWDLPIRRPPSKSSAPSRI